MCDQHLESHRSRRHRLTEPPTSPRLTLDAVYAHDASLPTDFGLIPMNPGKPNRAPEAAHHRDFCSSLGLPTLDEIKPPAKTEAGDMVWIVGAIG